MKSPKNESTNAKADVTRAAPNEADAHGLQPHGIRTADCRGYLAS